MSSDTPPARGQFRKGQSGNPKGRPRGAGTATSRGSAFDIIVDRQLTILKDGIPTEVSVEEALQHRTYAQAVGGSRAARRAVLKMILKRERALAEQSPPPATKIEQLFEKDPENANDALVILGIARRWSYGPNDSTDRLKLEPWAVQAALRRRRGGSKLTSKQIEEIHRSTWEPETLVWPRGTDR